MNVRYRVEWHPGIDQLLGVCHCGATHVADTPTEVWRWLLAHPAGHTSHLPDPPPVKLTGVRA